MLMGNTAGGNETSETSSYASSDENDHNQNQQHQTQNTHKQETKVAMDDIGMLNEGEEVEEQTYSKFKTQNEIDPEHIEKFAPKIPILDELDDIEPFG